MSTDPLIALIDKTKEEYSPSVTPRRKPGPQKGFKQHRQPEPKPLNGHHDPLSLAAFLSSSDSTLRERYFSTLPLDKAIDELSRLRAIAEIAAVETNKRTIPDLTKCDICGNTIPENRAPIQSHVWKDENDIYHRTSMCSVNCVREFNKTKYGLKEMIK